jgi:hypothetical protein
MSWDGPRLAGECEVFVRTGAVVDADPQCLGTSLFGHFAKWFREIVTCAGGGR